MKPSRTTSALAFLAVCFVPAAALADPGHPGHDAGFSAGLLHPLLGWDHLLAMVAVGMWAAQLGGRARWAVPGAFIMAMILGAAAGMRGLQTGLVEPLILASLVILGLLIASATRLHLSAGMLLVSGFAFFHGAAHGAEIPLASTAWLYTAGFVAATLALHACGLLAASLALQSARVPTALRFAGAWIALTGAILSLQ